MKQTAEDDSILSLEFWRKQIIKRSFEALLITIMLLGVYWFLTIITFSINDPTFNKTVSHINIDNMGGLLGTKISSLSFFLFGYMAYLLPLFLIAKAAQTFKYRKLINFKNFWLIGYRAAGIILIILSGCVLAHLHFALTEALSSAGIISGGGVIGYAICALFLSSLSNQALTILSLLLFCSGLTMFLKFSWLHLADWLGKYTISAGEFISLKINNLWQKYTIKKQIN